LEKLNISTSKLYKIQTRLFMHCDDKRTIFALKQFIAESNQELQEVINQLKDENDNGRKIQIQTKISDLEKTIQDSKKQLESMK